MINQRFLISAVVALLVSAGTHGQSTGSEQPHPASIQTPKWVLMMDDPNANYYEALKAYEEYWKTHPMPMEEEEEMEGALPEKGVSEKEMKREERERERELERRKKLRGADLEVAEYLKYQNKRFKNWAREVKPWVQEDGRILTDEERTAIWKKQQEELRQQESK
jgi:ribosome-binding ATPase YchF (GTP1/OBG family)